MDEFCGKDKCIIDPNVLFYDGARSVLYGRYIEISQPRSPNFAASFKISGGLVLSWWNTMNFLLISSGRFFFRLRALILSVDDSKVYTQSLDEAGATHRGRLLFNIGKSFRGVNPGLVTICWASSCLHHNLFSTLLSYLIHMSSFAAISFERIRFRFVSAKNPRY